MRTISANNTEIIVTIDGLPIKLEHLASESDVWVKANDPELAAVERTADGKMVAYAKNDVISYTLTLSAASKEAVLIMNALQSQMKLGKAPSILHKIIVVITTDSFVSTYLDGVLTSGPVGFDIGQDKLLDLSWTFAFDRVLTIPKNSEL